MKGSPRLKGALIIVTLCAYPTIYFLALLGHSKFAHFGFKTSDIDGDYQFAWLMSKQSLLSTNNKFTNFPYGENLWRWQSLTHLLPTIVIQGLAKVVSFPVAVKLYCWLGWTFSGLVVARLSHIVSKHLAISLATGVLFQMLPWNRYLLETWIHYLWSGIPLIVVAVWLNTEPEMRFRVKFNFKVGFLLLLNAFFDGYWLYYSLMLVACLALFHFIPKGFRSQKKVAFSIGLVIALSSILGVLNYLKGVLAKDTLSKSLSRPLETTPKAFIDKYGGQFTDLFIPDTRHLFFPRDSRLVFSSWEVNPIQYIGVLALLVTIIGLFFAYEKRRVEILQLAVLVIVFLQLSFQTQIFGLPTLAGLVRGVTPGLQWVWRASIIAEAIMLVIVAFALSEIRKMQRVFTVFVIFLLITLDLNPFGGRRVVDTYKPWKEISEIVRSSPDSRFIFLPTTLPTQSWMEQVFIETPMVNGLFESSATNELKALEAKSECQALIWLVDNNITHVIGLKNYRQILGMDDMDKLDPSSLSPLFFEPVVTKKLVVVGTWVSDVVLAEVNTRNVNNKCRAS
jgi:hypothetical protein